MDWRFGQLFSSVLLLCVCTLVQLLLTVFWPFLWLAVIFESYIDMAIIFQCKDIKKASRPVNQYLAYIYSLCKLRPCENVFPFYKLLVNFFEKLNFILFIRSWWNVEQDMEMMYYGVQYYANNLVSGTRLQAFIILTCTTRSTPFFFNFIHMVCNFRRLKYLERAEEWYKKLLPAAHKIISYDVRLFSLDLSY